MPLIKMSILSNQKTKSRRAFKSMISLWLPRVLINKLDDLACGLGLTRTSTIELAVLTLLAQYGDEAARAMLTIKNYENLNTKK